MKNILKHIILILLIVGPFNAKSQATDSLAAIKAFYKVVSFSQSPTLFYKAVTELHSTPVLEPEDTATYQCEFIRLPGELYIFNAGEELFLKEGYLVNINRKEKRIAIRKWKDGKEPFKFLPPDSARIREMLRDNYSISMSSREKNISLITFEKTGGGEFPSVQTKIELLYDRNNWLPIEFSITRSIKQETDKAGFEELKGLGIATDSVVKQIGNKWYLVREQRIRTRFTEFSVSGKKKMPELSNRLAMKDGQFITTAAYNDFEVINDY